MNASRTTKAVLLGGVVLLAVAGIGLGISGYRLRQLRQAFAEVERGDTEAAVVAAMGEPNTAGAPTMDRTFWDDQVLDDDNHRIAKELRYRHRLFYLPRTFAIGLDENGLVVAKHVFD